MIYLLSYYEKTGFDDEYLFKKEDKFVEPSHVIPAPDQPISSFKLAQALNPKTEPLKLTRFSNDEDPYVRKAVCRNPSLPRAELEKLAKDKDQDVAKEALRILKPGSIFYCLEFSTPESPVINSFYKFYKTLS